MGRIVKNPENLSYYRFFLTIFLLLAVFGLSGCREQGGSQGPPNVLLISVGSLRPDSIGCYGFKRAETPVIDSLASRGVLFNNAYCTSDMANPSSVALLTSSRGGAASSSLPEIFKARGYATGGCAGTFLLDREVFPPAESFDSYYSPGMKLRTLRAPDVNLFAATFLEKHRDRPWFLWLDYCDPTESRETPVDYMSAGRSPYDQKLTYLDYWLGNLFSLLEDTKCRDRTLIILTGDHGQALGEHGLSNEHLGLYEEIVRVPLIISCPGRLPAHTEVAPVVSTIDVLPTILDILKMPVDKGAEGVSLVPLISKKSAGAHERIYAEDCLGRVSMVRQGDWKLISYNADISSIHKSHNESPAPKSRYFEKRKGEKELFNLKSDSLEHKDLSKENPGRVAGLESLLPGGEEEGISYELLLRMRILGY